MTHYPITLGTPVMTVSMYACRWCGRLHSDGGMCPRVKAIEYYPDNTVRRVEFWPEAEQPVPAQAGMTGATGEDFWNG